MIKLRQTLVDSSPPKKIGESSKLSGPLQTPVISSSVNKSSDDLNGRKSSVKDPPTKKNIPKPINFVRSTVAAQKSTNDQVKKNVQPLTPFSKSSNNSIKTKPVTDIAKLPPIPKLVKSNSNEVTKTRTATPQRAAKPPILVEPPMVIEVLRIL